MGIRPALLCIFIIFLCAVGIGPLAADSGSEADPSLQTADTAHALQQLRDDTRYRWPGVNPIPPTIIDEPPTLRNVSNETELIGANHYGKPTLRVAIAADAVADRPMTEHNKTREHITIEALNFWQEHSADYAYPVNYTLVDDDPDVKIQWVGEITFCDHLSYEPLACGWLPDGQLSREYAPIEIKPGISDHRAVWVLKHELGHTLGLDHDDGPADIMGASAIPSEHNLSE